MSIAHHDLAYSSGAGVVDRDIYIDGVTGNDSNSGLSKTAPLATIAGYFAKYGTILTIGSAVRVHLAGTGGADPWVSPVSQQVYGADVIDFGQAGFVGNCLVFRGPTNMILGVPATGPATAALDVALPARIIDDTGAANPAGQRTELLFTVAAPGWTAHDFGPTLQGYFCRVTVIATGNKLIYEQPIADNTASSIILDDGGVLAPLVVAAGAATLTVEIVYPAAAIRGATDLGAGIRVCMVRGAGAITGLAPLVATDMGANFERLVLVTAQVVSGTAISYDRCCVIPGAGITSMTVTGSCHFVNCHGVQTSIQLENNAYHGRDVGCRPDAAANPVNQIDMVCAIFNQLIVASNSRFVADKNLSVYGSTGAGIAVDTSACFEQTDGCVYLGGDSNTTYGITCDNNSTALLKGGAAAATGTATQIIGAAGALKVDEATGIGYGLGAGDFGEVAGFNGLYHNTSFAAGVTSGRMSVIRIF